MPNSSDTQSGRRPSIERALGRAELAAEFLKRNRSYRAEYQAMERRIADGAADEQAARAAFAKRWGLSFRNSAG